MKTDSFLSPEEVADIEAQRKAFYASFGLPDEGQAPANIDYLKLVAKAGELDLEEAWIQSLLAENGCTAFIEQGEVVMLGASWKLFHQVQDYMFELDCKRRADQIQAEKKAAKKGEVLPPPEIKEGKLDSQALIAEYKKLKEWGLAQGFTKTELLAWWGATTDKPDELKATLDRLQKFKAQIARQIDDRLSREFAAMFGVKFGFEIPAEWQGARLAYLGEVIPEVIEVGGQQFSRDPGYSGGASASSTGEVQSTEDLPEVSGSEARDTSDAISDTPGHVLCGAGSDVGESLVSAGILDDASAPDSGSDPTNSSDETDKGGQTLAALYQALCEEFEEIEPTFTKEAIDKIKQDLFGEEAMSEALLSQLSDYLKSKLAPPAEQQAPAFKTNEDGEVDLPAVLQVFGWVEFPQLTDPDIEKKIEDIGDVIAGCLDSAARYRQQAEARAKEKEDRAAFYRQVFGELIQKHAQSKVKTVKTGKNAGKPVSGGKTVHYATFSVSFEKVGGMWISSKDEFEKHLKAKPELMNKLGVKEKTVLDYKPADIIQKIKDKVVSIDDLKGMADVAPNEFGKWEIKGLKKEKAS